jgi:hypothetical protein
VCVCVRVCVFAIHNCACVRVYLLNIIYLLYIC